MQVKNNFNEYANQSGEIGYVTEIRYPIVSVTGLPNVRLHELVFFETGDTGEVFSLHENAVHVGLMSRTPVPLDTRVTRLQKTLSFPFGDQLLGSAIDPLGNILLGEKKDYKDLELISIFSEIPPLFKRRRIKQQLNSGVRVADLLLPIGKGQKQLLIGDRKTGKRQFALQCAQTAVQNGMKVIYALTGQNHSDIRFIWEYLYAHSLDKSSVVVASSSIDSPSLIYLTPYVAMAIAEYYAKKDIDTLVIFDDLTTHAQFYRELSLLAGRFPGRDSYPGDIFYIHSSLLERAGNFEYTPGKEVSITCLPMVQIIDGDFTSYISTNSIGITDGHLYFDRDSYLKGLRPAIHIGLSVTRAGKQTQPALLRDINHSVTSFLAEYERVSNFSRFGAELTPNVKEMLEKGSRIYNFFHQSEDVFSSPLCDLLLFALIWNELVDVNTATELEQLRLNLTTALESQASQFEQIGTFSLLSELSDFVRQNEAGILALCGYNK
jgi:F-type H+/Na+-transporting ATPase subunit alpha